MYRCPLSFDYSHRRLTQNGVFIVYQQKYFSVNIKHFLLFPEPWLKYIYCVNRQGNFWDIKFRKWKQTIIFHFTQNTDFIKKEMNNTLAILCSILLTLSVTIATSWSAWSLYTCCSCMYLFESAVISGIVPLKGK